MPRQIDYAITLSLMPMLIFADRRYFPRLLPIRISLFAASHSRLRRIAYAALAADTPELRRQR